MLKAVHPTDGSDALGDRLPVTIRIGPDGRVYFHDVTAEMLPIALALSPDDEGLKQRLAAASAMLDGPAGANARLGRPPHASPELSP